MARGFLLVALGTSFTGALISTSNKDFVWAGVFALLCDLFFVFLVVLHLSEGGEMPPSDR